MNGVKLAGIVLIVASVLALVYGGFSYTRPTEGAKLGPFELSVRENKTVNIPVWAGVAGLVVGGVLVFYGRKKDR